MKNHNKFDLYFLTYVFSLISFQDMKERQIRTTVFFVVVKHKYPKKKTFIIYKKFTDIIFIHSLIKSKPED